MAIQTIRVYNYFEMKDALIHLPEDASVIGCIDKGGLVRDQLFDTDDYKLLLRFDDCTPENCGGLYKTMTTEQATQVVRFIENLVDSRVRYDLHVHCIGGQARSTAIAKFAAWVANLERKDIKTNNPFRPNPHVEHMLEQAYRRGILLGAKQ